LNRLTLFVLLVLLILVPSSLISTAQPRPDAPEFAQRGPYTVGTQDYILEDDARPLNLAVWYPAINPDEQPEEAVYNLGLFQFYGQALIDAQPAADAGPYPLVIFSHGSGGFRYQSLYFTEHLASHGFVVMAVDHTTNTLLDSLNADPFTEALAANFVQRPQDILRIIDFADALNADGELAGLIDTERIATTGHSFGGYTALAAAGLRLNLSQLAQTCGGVTQGGVCFLLENAPDMVEAVGQDFDTRQAWPAISDPRIAATIAMAPWNEPILDRTTLAAHNTPTLIIYGSNDQVTPPNRDAIPIFQRMSSSPRTLITFANGGHYLFVDKCGDLAINMGFFSSCSDSVWDMDRAHDLINHYSTAFLMRELYGENTSAVFSNSPVGVTINTLAGDLGNYQSPAELVPEVIDRFPHDTAAFTQGLLLHEGTFYESTGLYGESDLRQVDPETGDVLRIVGLQEAFFAEGLARINNRLIQITWRENTAIEYDLETFEVTNVFNYEGEGWGLCYDGSDLYMSDGSAQITRRDPDTFEAVETYTVTLDNRPVERLNELECVDDHIYANVWQTDYIMRFDKATGVIDQRIDASQLRAPDEISGDVLNGIAYDGENFYITGKLWPVMYYVRFVPADTAE